MTDGSSVSGIIAFLDSGVGGLPYLKAAREALSGKVMHYLADDAGFPYGTKSAEQVKDLLFDRVRRLKARFQPDAIVVACDTASQIALSEIKSAHPDISILGTQPPIKKAAETTRTGKIGVLASARTIQDSQLDDIIARYASDVETIRVPAQDLVSFVEYRYLYSNGEERRAAVEPYVRYYAERGVDRVVLACSHFLHLTEDFSFCIRDMSHVFGGSEEFEMLIVDSIESVTHKLGELYGAGSASGRKPIEPQRSDKESCANGEGCLLLTREPPFAPLYSLWARRFLLSGPEPL